jgi:hypothetical protein
MPVPPRTTAEPSRTPGKAPRVAATCIVLSFMIAVVLVTDPLMERADWTAVALAKRQAMLVWVYGGALVILQVIAGLALYRWWKAR